MQISAENAPNMEDKCDKLQAALKLNQQVLHRHHTAIRDTINRLACLYAEMGRFRLSLCSVNS